jgi:hypothetical protein
MQHQVIVDQNPKQLGSRTDMSKTELVDLQLVRFKHRSPARAADVITAT